MLHIETEEFEQERRIFDMWNWIDTKIAEMEAFPDFDLIYFKQKGKNVKKLIEEAIPISKLGLYLLDHRKDIWIRCLTGNQNFDATLRFAGGDDSQIKVEVTTTQPEEAVAARLQLAQHGFTWRPALFQINEEGAREIVPQMVDIVEQCEKWAEEALAAAGEKLKWDSYGADTAILVRVDAWRAIPLSIRAELVSKSRQRFGNQLAKVYDLYYLHSTGIDSVKRNDF